jgi:UDP-N-acetylglucosamine/UDP-N-acetylgalactosamine diphosphorylase
MSDVPVSLRRKLQEHGQGHVLAWWGGLTDEQERELCEQLRAIDLDLLDRLYGRRDEGHAGWDPARIAPVPVVPPDGDDREARRLGSAALDRGEVAILVVAGGQGSRLGFDHPKGLYPVGPVSRRSLFQVHAEKVLALRRRHAKPLPLLVMTSPATDAETRRFFAEHGRFGLPAADVAFFRQGTMPALDLATGKLLMDSPYRILTSPDGHGGALTALAESGLLDRLRAGGIRHVFYFQVDNPLVKVGDAAFLGHHLAARAEVSTKVLPKRGPADRLGNVVQIDGRCTIIEYSDLPDDLARRTDAHGRLRLAVGSPAIHYFDVAFLERVTRGGTRLPFHVARKKVAYLDATGRLVHPERENALKFEQFIFDALPMADRWAVVETSWQEEFAPLKNATGPDSPAAVEQAISDLAADWLERAGVNVPRRTDRGAAVPLEISPLFALDAEELARKVDRTLRIDGPTYLTS